MTAYELLLIGGGAGVGKTTVGGEVSSALQGRGTAHCLIEGDYMDQIHPAPRDDPHRAAITERNTAAVWSNYAALGQHRAVWTRASTAIASLSSGTPGEHRPPEPSWPPASSTPRATRARTSPTPPSR